MNDDSADGKLKLAKAYDVCKKKTPRLTVVLIHGIATNSKSFDGLIKYLSGKDSVNDIRFVAFDLLGAGKSYTSDELNYDFKEQLEALDNSIQEFNIKTPLIIIAHSMGTMIAAHYANEKNDLVKELILVSPPIYRKEDINNPMFKKAMDGFKEIVSHKDHNIVKTKAFNNEINLIISNPENYDYFAKLTQPTYIIYGELDKFIAPLNIPGLLEKNQNITATKTIGSHGVTRDKYDKILEVLEKALKSKEAA